MRVTAALLVAKPVSYQTYLENCEIKRKAITKVYSISDLLSNDALTIKITLLETLKCKFFDSQTLAANRV